MVAAFNTTSSSSATIAAYEYDVSDDGVMLIKWNRAATAEESRELMRLIQRQWTRGRAYVAAMITHPAVNADARHRKLWSDWHVENRQQIERYCKGMAITLDSPGIRALMTVISWFSSNRYPIKYVATESDAVQWARAQLR